MAEAHSRRNWNRETWVDIATARGPAKGRGKGKDHDGVGRYISGAMTMLHMIGPRVQPKAGVAGSPLWTEKGDWTLATVHVHCNSCRRVLGRERTSVEAISASATTMIRYARRYRRVAAGLELASRMTLVRIPDTGFIRYTAAAFTAAVGGMDALIYSGV